MFLRAFVTAAIAGAAFASSVALKAPAPLSAAAPVAMVAFILDPAHTMVQFKVRHLGISTVTGRFATFTGAFQLDPATGEAADAQLSIDAASINTDNDRRNADLRSPNFFNTDTFPKITFASTSIQKTSGNKYKMNGNLTMHGVTKPVTLDVELSGTRQTARGWIAALSMTGSIKRKEFGLTWDRMTEGVAVVSDDVTLLIDVEAKTAPPAP